MRSKIIERQSQQSAEQMQIELGIEPRPDHRDDRPPGIGRRFDRLEAIPTFRVRGQDGGAA